MRVVLAVISISLLPVLGLVAQQSRPPPTNEMQRDGAWARVAGLGGKKIVVIKHDASEIRGRLLRVERDVLVVGLKGLTAEVKKDGRVGFGLAVEF